MQPKRTLQPRRNSNNKNIVIKKKMIVTNKNFRIKKNTNTKSCYRINSLSMKHVDAPKSISVWVCPWIVVEVVARVTC